MNFPKVEEVLKKLEEHESAQRKIREGERKKELLRPFNILCPCVSPLVDVSIKFESMDEFIDIKKELTNLCIRIEGNIKGQTSERKYVRAWNSLPDAVSSFPCTIAFQYSNPCFGEYEWSCDVESAFSEIFLQTRWGRDGAIEESEKDISTGVSTFLTNPQKHAWEFQCYGYNDFNKSVEKIASLRVVRKLRADGFNVDAKVLSVTRPEDGVVQEYVDSFTIILKGGQ